MKRAFKALILVVVLVCCGVFAAALAGGLMDDQAFTQAARDAAH